MQNKLLVLFLAFSLFYVGLNTHVSAKENFNYILEKNATVNVANWTIEKFSEIIYT